ncbi:cinnamycin family lantibiotic [Nocardiopsis sp. CNT-189]|uniref:cinnamycin family lantibiotic n=1 Tax=Nocardiopsis oceanisediminis TaxID=2816862 RepID=UPI003B340FA2
MTQSTILRQAAADAEFRRILLADPSAFGIPADSVPASVEQPDAASLEFWTRGQGAMETVACRTSCSWGPITAVCDGSTKP